MDNKKPDYPQTNEGETLMADVCARAEQAIWLNLGETHLSCVDGREHRPVIGMPGGDAGIFVAALSMVEKKLQRTLSPEEAIDAMKRYEETMGHALYLHTDHHAATPSPDEEINADLHIGCGHLRLAVKNPDLYGMRPELIKYVKKSFYTTSAGEELENLLPTKDAFQPAVLKGEHKEEAVIIIKKAPGQTLSPGSEAPALIPNKNGRQFFVFHEGVTEYVAHHIAENINNIIPECNLDAEGVETFAQELKDLFFRQTGETVRALAKDKDGNPLPRYEVTITKTDNGKNQVEIVEVKV